MSNLAIQMPSGRVHLAVLVERDGGFTHVAICGVVEHGYSVFRAVDCPRCIETRDGGRELKI